MILIADSGSTKTDWALVDNDGQRKGQYATKGINPFHFSDDDIQGIISNELVPQITNCKVDKIYFYGAGCNESQQQRMKDLLGNALSCNDVNVDSDLMGAAIALCGDSEGIACILGTGSNSCLYDGHRIVENIPPLGYILGDEGSGAVLGRHFMTLIFKDKRAESIKDLYLEETHQAYNDIIYNVYSAPAANRYLASASKFIGKHINDFLELRTLVRQNFNDFFERNIDRYGRMDLPVSFVGSIAWYFRDDLSFVAEQHKYTIGEILQRPLDGMIEHLK